MTVTVRDLVPTKVLEAALTTQYTCLVGAAIIDKFTVFNNSASVAATLTVSMCKVSETPGPANQLLEKVLQPKESYTCPEISGHCMNLNDRIVTGTSATTIVGRIGGREIT
jgi:hypothetical protein